MEDLTQYNSAVNEALQSTEWAKSLMDQLNAEGQAKLAPLETIATLAGVKLADVGINNLMSAGRSALSKGAQKVADMAKQKASDVVNELKSNVQDKLNAVKQQAQEAVEGVKGQVQEGIEGLQQQGQQALGQVQEGIEGLQQQGQQALGQVQEGMQSLQQQGQEALEQGQGAIQEAGEGLGQDFLRLTQPVETEMTEMGGGRLGLTPPETQETNIDEALRQQAEEDLPEEAEEVEIPEEIAEQYGRGAFAQLVARGGLDDIPPASEPIPQPALDAVEPQETSPFSSVLDNLSPEARQDYQDILDGRPTTAQNLPDDLFEQAMGERANLTKTAPLETLDEPEATPGSSSNVIGRILRQQQQEAQEQLQDRTPSLESQQMIEQKIQQEQLEPEQQQTPSQEGQPTEETIQESTQAPEQLAPETTQSIAPEVSEAISPQVSESIVPQVTKTATGAVSDATTGVTEGVTEGLEGTTDLLETIGGGLASLGEAAIPAAIVGGLTALISKFIPEHEAPPPLNPSTQFL